MNFRKLRADEIDVRVGSVSEGRGVSLLLYKDARCDMNILDETVGTENWQRNHELINGNLFCNVGILVNNQWVWKQDVGVESYTEKEKGQASDSFKRACVCWGIGRELYTAPFIWFKAADTKQDGKKCNDKFVVKEIAYNGNEISKLWVEDTSTNKSFKFGYGKQVEDLKQEPAKEEPQQEQVKLATIPQKRALKSIAEKHKINLEMIYIANNCTEDTLTCGQATYLLTEFNKKYGE